MRIAYFYRYGILGGVATQLINRLSYLDQRTDVSVRIFFGQDNGLSKTLRPSDTILYGLSSREIKRHLVYFDPDIITVIDSPEYIPFARRYCPSAKVITEVHTTVDRGLSYLDEPGFETDYFMVPSRYSQDLVSKRADIDSHRILVTPNSLNTELFRKTTVTEPPSTPIVLWVGKLDEHKNWREALAIARALRRKGTEFELWMVGGETAPAENTEEVLNTAEAYGVIDVFRWFDRIEYSAMPALYNGASESGGCKLVTSINESFGMSVLEALCCGCPVVSTEVGAIPDIAPSQNYIKLYPLSDISQATSLVAYFIGENAYALQQELLEDRSTIASRFSPEHVGEKYLQELQKLL